MAECPRCHAETTTVQTPGGERLPLDNHESAVGPDRYVITDYETTPWTAEPLDPTTSVSGYTDHRATCLLS